MLSPRCRKHLYCLLSMQIVGSQEISGRLVANPINICHRRTGLSRPNDGRLSNMIDVDSTLNIEPTFCYLGGTLSAGGGSDRAIAA